ncbi:hypothetical protein F0L74_31380 [Chitinophaga agrisoli]|uniref:Lipoprotein n=1 Tax=Chitinophaga agrisoli TaxID=2607653 RepID=A0A5B2VQX6_9BACT|nr:hypothetical protein [Chitinophaga agrisoli]KAA2240652.1 hypothetical protein F0L74_31380 [Chitinophaga agrisoli]
MKFNRSLLSGGIAMLICLLAACSKDETPPAGSSLIITRYASMSVGNWIAVKITTDDSYKTEKGVTYNFKEDTVHYITLTKEQHNTVKDLLPAFPLGKLQDSGEDNFGCRSCTDQLVYVFTYKAPDGETETWEVEDTKAPDFMEDYMKQVHDKLQTAGL